MADEDPGGRWQCQVANCGYIYDPAKGDRKERSRRAPSCGAGKKMFKKIERSVTEPHRC